MVGLRQKLDEHQQASLLPPLYLITIHHFLPLLYPRTHFKLHLRQSIQHERNMGGVENETLDELDGALRTECLDELVTLDGTLRTECLSMSHITLCVCVCVCVSYVHVCIFIYSCCNTTRVNLRGVSTRCPLVLHVGSSGVSCYIFQTEIHLSCVCVFVCLGNTSCFSCQRLL